MRYEKSCGAVCFRKSHGNIEVLLIKSKNSQVWSLPKGHIEKNETEIETAKREVKEETNIDILIDQTFHEKVTYFPQKGLKKDVIYFLGMALNHDPRPQPDEVVAVKWYDINFALKVLFYENDINVVRKARRLLKKYAV